MLPFDLHVLSMPPAFNLSQDQTLQFNSCASLKPASYFSIYFISTQSLSKCPHSLSSLFLMNFTLKVCCVFYSFQTQCQTLFPFFLKLFSSLIYCNPYRLLHIHIGYIFILYSDWRSSFLQLKHHNPLFYMSCNSFISLLKFFLV